MGKSSCQETGKLQSLLSEVYSESRQTSKMDRFAKIFNG